ncbi:MAG: 2-oxo acid dehydrogenase subunit E2, partial [Flavobacteriales bacterium]|nr:2-oxo acid dehydrogenase subunit E2 [Flavobacteriales bacterium]
MKVPSPGESISEVEIAEWLVKDGDYVEKDQSIAEIDSDKATLELPAEQSGKITIIVNEGETVAVGDIVCTIDTSIIGESKETFLKDKDSAEIKSNDIIKKQATLKKATPLASAIISDLEISENEVKGTGELGKITKNDVLDAVGVVSESGPRGTSRKKMSSLRRKIASRLVAVRNETAMLTTFNEVDMTKIFEIRKTFKDKFIDKYDVGLGFMSFFTKSVTIALKEFPDVNSMIDKNEIIHHNYSDIGIAVSAPKGLMVPVVRNAELLNFHEIES